MGKCNEVHHCFHCNFCFSSYSNKGGSVYTCKLLEKAVDGGGIYPDCPLPDFEHPNNGGKNSDK
jgi:hypothetical protein